MNAKQRTGWVVAGLVFLTSLGAGPSGAQKMENGLTSNPENQLRPLNESHNYSSQEGDFRILWPSGCANLKTRIPRDDNLGEDESYYAREYPVVVTCDRNSEEGEGCSVTAIFNPRDKDGEPAGPSEVTLRMQYLLEQFGAKVKRQAPVRKDFGDGLVIEGLDALAAQTGGSGQVWLRGLMVGSDIYVLAAWDLQGRVWDNLDYLNFFNSFQPGAE